MLLNTGKIFLDHKCSRHTPFKELRSFLTQVVGAQLNTKLHPCPSLSPWCTGHVSAAATPCTIRRQRLRAPPSLSPLVAHTGRPFSLQHLTALSDGRAAQIQTAPTVSRPARCGGIRTQTQTQGVSFETERL